MRSDDVTVLVGTRAVYTSDENVRWDIRCASGAASAATNDRYPGIDCLDGGVGFL